MNLTMHDRDGVIWLDGEMVQWRDAQLHFLTHSLHYGMAVFEGVRSYETGDGASVFRLDEHSKRLFNSAKIFEMAVPFSFDTIREAQLEVVRQNHLGACYIRPLVWLGSEQMGLGARGNTVHVGIAAWPWGSYLGEEGLSRGIRVKTSSLSRHHVNVSMVRAKASGYYINSILANREVTRNGYDEALLLDTDGYVSEGAGENVFIVRNGVLYTPDLASCLDGITRASIMDLAVDHGFKVVEKRITRDEMYCADEAFFTGTAAEVTPIRELDDRVIGSGTRGPVTAALQESFFAVVSGKGQRSSQWLTSLNASK